MALDLKHTIRRLFINPGNTRTRKYVIYKFALNVGLRYYGVLGKKSYRQRDVRGFTSSPSHQDNHYSAGVVSGYDVALVDRVDAVWKSDGNIDKHAWLIMSFVLHTKQDVPHIFINAKNHDNEAYAGLFAAYPALHRIEMGMFENYSPEFVSRFAVYAPLYSSVMVQKLLPARAMMVLAAHFWPLSVEINQNVVYIYAPDKQIASNLLESMLKCGIWLSKYVDGQIERI